MDSNNPKNQTKSQDTKKNIPQTDRVSNKTPVSQSAKIEESNQPQQTPLPPQANAQIATPIQPASQASGAQLPPQMPGGIQAPPPSMPERIRRDFSFAQVLASVFSTVTCMVLAPKIGLLGGLLGAAIGAGVAAVASQVYKSILYNTSDKIKYKQQLIMAHAHRKQAKQGKDSGNASHPATLTGQMKAIAEDSLINTMEVAANITQEPPSETETSTPTSSTQEQLTPPSQIADEQDAAGQKSQIWKYILVIAGVTMLSVAASVGVIDYITKGEGWGKKPEVVYITRYITSKDDNTTPSSNQQTQNQPSTDSQTNANQNEQNKQPEQNGSENKTTQDQEQNQSPKDNQTQEDTPTKPEDNNQSSSKPTDGKEEPQKSVQAAKEDSTSHHKNS